MVAAKTKARERANTSSRTFFLRKGYIWLTAKTKERERANTSSRTGFLSKGYVWLTV